MEKKVTVTYAEFNEAFPRFVKGYQITVNESDVQALEDILTRNGYGIICL